MVGWVDKKSGMTEERDSALAGWVLFSLLQTAIFIDMEPMETKKTENPMLETEIREICTILSQIDDQQLIFDFFGCLFTKSELNDFSKRWSLVKELGAGTTQREIARKYSMSLCNITRGSKEMKKENSAFRKILDFRAKYIEGKENGQDD